MDQRAEEVYASAPPKVKNAILTQLVGKIYQEAPPVQRSALIAQLMKPLGILSLVAVANGVFAKIRFRAGWPELQARVDDVQNIQVSDIMALASYAQQVSGEAIGGLADLLIASPLLASSVAAALLVKILLKTRRSPINHDAQWGD
ncbi:MAG: hypothetical protein CVU24_00335 [Betaproteobacteria bacterium HGW-Betaproteobacteria-18]|nr:MAG: hypothetical protein CVU24_00335 [Betaproteobacteria bacterium HGW-Betaproteobacteria-18]